MQHEPERIDFDCVVVGGGPAGLSAALRLKQQHPKCSIAILEKSRHIGAHLVSGAIVIPSAFGELGLDWRHFNPYGTVEQERFYFLTKTQALPLWLPKTLRHKGQPMVSLNQLCQALAAKAEAMGIHIFTGFAAQHFLIDKNRIIGVQTGAFGLDHMGEKTSQYQPGTEVCAKYTILAEGCYGSLSQVAIKRFNLANPASKQTYGLGIREVWEVKPEQHQPGLAMHTIGWPNPNHNYGGGFIYHTHQPHRIIIGHTMALTYQNAYTDPHFVMQTLKTHPMIRPTLEGGARLQYGARSIVEGGYQALPQLTFPGGALVGDSAGLLDTARLKGIHHAMHSGIYAADAIAEQLKKDKKPAIRPEHYQHMVATSPMHQQLYSARNLVGYFNRFHPLIAMPMAYLDVYVLKGHVPWTLKHAAPKSTLSPEKSKPIDYPEVDHTLVFDKASSVAVAQTMHDPKAPCHLKIDPEQSNIAQQYHRPELYYCPAGVYTQHPETGSLVIHAEQCLHCKTCAIKDPGGHIHWTVPQGGEGPVYGH